MNNPVSAHHQGLFPSGYQIVFTTTNPQKTEIGKDIIVDYFGSDYSGSVNVVTIKPRLNQLKTPSQPVGDDIKYGAISRLDVVKPTLAQRNPSTRILVSFENGLRVDHQSKNRDSSDVASACVEINGRRYYAESVEVPVQINGERVGLLTEDILHFLENNLAGYNFTTCYELLSPEQKRVYNVAIYGHENGTDDKDDVSAPQVAGFRQRVIEPLAIKAAVDYWNVYTDGRLTRGQGLSQALKSAISEFINSQSGEEKLALAETLKQTLISLGLPASLGGRYGSTVWMRDFGIMIDTLNHQDVASPEAFSTLVKSLAAIACEQKDNGLIPQVVIPDPLLKKFVYERILGGDYGGGWYAELQCFLGKHYPEEARQLPQLSAEDLRTLSQPVMKKSVDALKKIHQEISEKAKKDGFIMPNPGHTLGGFLTNRLATLTPGTTDSEIHFIRSFTKLLDLATSDEHIKQLQLLIPNLAKAIAYMEKNVLDPHTGLPQGGDNRDMLDKYLLKKLLCSNACFLYQGLSGLVRHYDKIGSELAVELNKHFTVDQKLKSGVIAGLCGNDKDPATALKELHQALGKLHQQIKTTFIYPEGTFAPLDFVDSDHEVHRQPESTPDYIPPLVEQNTDFLEGREVNLQGLALAIELGLVDQDDHPEAVGLINKQLTTAGLKAFSPINMVTDHERTLLQKSLGFLVWPQIEHRVIHVMKNYMEKTSKITELLSELETIHQQRPGFHEWYNTDDTAGECKIYAGGAENQSWHITHLTW